MNQRQDLQNEKEGSRSNGANLVHESTPSFQLLPPPFQLKVANADQLEEQALDDQEITQLQTANAEPPPSINNNNSRKNNGLPTQLKRGVEALSGFSMDDVQVHYNSSKPAQLQAHAYAQGTDIHIASGQEKHLPHEAWHVVQQKQGRVKPTVQLKGAFSVNDDESLEREADVMGGELKNHFSQSTQYKTHNPHSISHVDVVQMVKNKLVPYATSDYSADAREWREEEDLGARNIATISYTVNATGKRYRTSEKSEGVHSEKRLYLWLCDEFGENFLDNIEIHWLFTERETCGSDCNNCASHVWDWFGITPDQVKCSIIYPEMDEVSGDEEEVKRKKAKTRRRKSTNMIRRFQTRANQVNAGNAQWADPMANVVYPAPEDRYPQNEQFKWIESESSSDE